MPEHQLGLIQTHIKEDGCHPFALGSIPGWRTTRRGISLGDQVVGGLETAGTRVVSSGPDHAEVWAPRSTNGYTHGVVAVPLGVPSQPVVLSLRVWALPAHATLRVSAGQRPGEDATGEGTKGCVGFGDAHRPARPTAIEGLGSSPLFPCIWHKSQCCV